MEREKRSTKGLRMTALVGKALEEDELFYKSDIWNDDSDVSENESFVDENESEEDEFDSDFDDDEDEEDDEDLGEDSIRKTEAKQIRRVGKQDNKYKEPLKAPKRKG